MTCIVGLVHNNKIWMGGDSAGVAGNRIDIRKDPKVFLNGEFLIGFTSSFRQGDILKYLFKPPEHPLDMDNNTFMVSIFIESIRKTFNQRGFGTSNSGQEQGGCFLVGYRKHLYSIESDYQVGELTLPFNAVGCGAIEALAAMYAIQNNDYTPKERVEIALKTATYFNTGVTGPFNILSI